MQIGMLGLGRMGANMVRRLMRAGCDCVVYDVNTDAVDALSAEGATGAYDLKEFVAALRSPRTIWLMVPAALVDRVIADLVESIDTDDVLVDGGNSFYRDAIARASKLRERGAHFLDVGVSGGVHGLERGFCLMIGGEQAVVARLAPFFDVLAPGNDLVSSTPDRVRRTTADCGYLHCGAQGAGHFVKMVHNGIEYGMMAALAEGFSLLKQANVGNAARELDAETSPLRTPEYYQYDFDVGEIAEVWRRGSVISSWLLDLVSHALLVDEDLEKFSGRVSDSGEGRWTVLSGIDMGVPTPVLSAALYQRFTSRDGGDFGNRLLSALRGEFGGHAEKKADGGAETGV